MVVGGTLNYGLGQTLPLLIGFLLIPVYTALLTPADYGIIEICAAISTMLAVLMRFGIPGAVTRFYYEHEEGPVLRDYVTSIAWFLRANAILVGTAAVIVGYLFVHVLIPGFQFFPYVPLAVVVAMLTANSDLQRRLVQVRRQSSYSAKLSIANSSIAIILAITFVVGFRWGATGMLLAQVVTGLIFASNATMYLWPDLKGKVRPDIIRSSLSYGRGIFTSHLIAGGGPLVSRSLLVAAASMGSVGLFSLASRIASPLTILNSAFGASYTPEYFAARKAGTDEALGALAKVESTIWSAGVQASLAVAVLGPHLLIVMTPERYHPAATLVPVLALGFLGQLLYSLLSPEMFYAKVRWLPAVVTATNYGTMIVLTFLLVGQYGAAGMAWATILGTGISSILCGLLGARRAPVPHDWTNLFKVLLISGASMALATAMSARTGFEGLLLGGLVLVANAAILLAAGDPLMCHLAARGRARLRGGA